MSISVHGGLLVHIQKIWSKFGTVTKVLGNLWVSQGRFTFFPKPLWMSGALMKSGQLVTAMHWWRWCSKPFSSLPEVRIPFLLVGLLRSNTLDCFSLNLLPLSSFVSRSILTKWFRWHVEGSHNLAINLASRNGSRKSIPWIYLLEALILRILLSRDYRRTVTRTVADAASKAINELKLQWQKQHKFFFSFRIRWQRWVWVI